MDTTSKSKPLSIRLSPAALAKLDQITERQPWLNRSTAIEMLITTYEEDVTGDKRIFRRLEVDPNNQIGWVVDLSPADAVNPDCYWYFNTRKEALQFAALVDSGFPATAAAHYVMEAAKIDDEE